MYTYHQQTGRFMDAVGNEFPVCYSGTGEGRNNPLMQNINKIGPIPKGHYKILPGITHPKSGPMTMKLIPSSPLKNGRSGFAIHGDNVKHDASTGCIVMDRASRDKINKNLKADNLLEVI